MASAALVRGETDVVLISVEHGVASGSPPEVTSSVGPGSRDVIFDGMPESIEERMSAACPPHSQDYVAARLFGLFWWAEKWYRPRGSKQTREGRRVGVLQVMFPASRELTPSHRRR